MLKCEIVVTFLGDGELDGTFLQERLATLAGTMWQERLKIPNSTSKIVKFYEKI